MNLISLGTQHFLPRVSAEDSFQTGEAQPQGAVDSLYGSWRGAEEEGGEHVEQINMSLGHKATRVMSRLMSAV